jgi:hypothetical protein
VVEVVVEVVFKDFYILWYICTMTLKSGGSGGITFKIFKNGLQLFTPQNGGEKRIKYK